MRRLATMLALGALVFSMTGAHADSPIPPFVGNGGQVQMLPAGSCTPESAFDIDNNARYGSACRRMHIVFGPIMAKPGQNDVLIQPVTFEKPMYDGYMVRFKPDLVGATGTPPVESLHLHHGTWLNAGRSYGSGPWLASGEEKTIVAWPKGYGLKILASDTWLFLHMVHNATPQAQPVWVTYDIDFVDLMSGDAIQGDSKPLITQTKSIWLDVGGGNFSPGTKPYLLNPVYNSQHGHGSIDPETGTMACSYPSQNCADFNSSNTVSDQQGVARTDVGGMEHVIPADAFGGQSEGTLVLMGGHLHTGGIRDEVSLVRCNIGGTLSACPMAGPMIDYTKVSRSDVVERTIHVSDGYYWNYADSTKIGASPVSWDFSMTGQSADHGWKIRIRPGDIIRLNALYDADMASWYENMGIVMTWYSDGHDDAAIDVFNPAIHLDRGVNALAPQPPAAEGWKIPGSEYGVCTQSATNLCLRGQITHGHNPAASHHATCSGATCPALPASLVQGPMVTNIPMGAFTYGLADLNAIAAGGIPRVAVGSTVTFWNADTAAYMWHTVTACAFPCTGQTSASYPVADGWRNAPDSRTMDFDSGELGVGAAPRQAVTWDFTPDRKGIFTFFCRIHPTMRGAIEVV